MDFPWAEATELLSRRPPAATAPPGPPAASAPPGAGNGQSLAGVKKAVRSGRYQAAISLLTRGVHASPVLDQILLRLHLAAALAYGRHAGRRWQTRALAHLREVTRTATPPGRLQAVVALYSGDAAKALNLYPDQPPAGIPEERWTLERALIALAAGQPEAVLPGLEAAAQAPAPDLRQDIAECLGACHWQRKDWVAAIHSWEKAVALGGRRLTAPLTHCYHQAALACQDSQPEMALAWWQAAHRLEPRHRRGRMARQQALRLRLLLAAENWRAGDIPAALSQWQAAAKLVPGDGATHRGMALAHLALGDGAAAAAAAKAGLAARAGGQDLALHYLQIGGLVLSGQLAAAAAAACGLARRQPKSAEVRAMGGLLLLVTGQPAAAALHLAPLAGEDSVPDPARKAMALAAGATGDVTGAVKRLGELMEVNPGDEWALRQWRELMVEQGTRAEEKHRPAEALKFLASALLQNRDDSELWFRAGVSHLSNNDPKAAESCFAEAVRSSPHPVPTLLAISGQYLQAGDAHAARHYLSQIRRRGGSGETSSASRVQDATGDWAMAIIRGQVQTHLQEDHHLAEVIPFLEAIPSQFLPLRVLLLLALLLLEDRDWTRAAEPVASAHAQLDGAPPHLARLHTLLSGALATRKTTGNVDREGLAQGRATLLGAVRERDGLTRSQEAAARAALDIVREQSRAGWGVAPPQPGAAPPPPPALEYRGPQLPLLSWWLQAGLPSPAASRRECLKLIAALEGQGSQPAQRRATPGHRTRP